MTETDDGHRTSDRSTADHGLPAQLLQFSRVRGCGCGRGDCQAVPSSSLVDDLTALLADWPVATATAAVTNPTTTLGNAGDAAWVTRIASVSKLLVGYAALVAIEEETDER